MNEDEIEASEQREKERKKEAAARRQAGTQVMGTAQAEVPAPAQPTRAATPPPLPSQPAAPPEEATGALTASIDELREDVKRLEALNMLLTSQKVALEADIQRIANERDVAMQQRGVLIEEKAAQGMAHGKEIENLNRQIAAGIERLGQFCERLVADGVLTTARIDQIMEDIRLKRPRSRVRTAPGGMLAPSAPAPTSIPPSSSPLPNPPPLPAPPAPVVAPQASGDVSTGQRDSAIVLPMKENKALKKLRRWMRMLGNPRVRQALMFAVAASLLFAFITNILLPALSR